MGRYKVPRVYVNWLRTDELRIAKQVAGVIKRFEAVGEFELWNRMKQVYPEVTAIVLGRRVEFQEIRDDVTRVQGLEITRNRLLGRADVVNREGYKETDQWTAPVTKTYLTLTCGTPTLDPRRSFTKDEVRQAAIRQKNRCSNPTCKAPFTALNPPVGDHANPYSLGGRTDLANCLALCWNCNSRKGSLTFMEFVAKCGMNNRGARRRLGQELEELEGANE